MFSGNIAVLSDIHSNADALAVVLDTLAIERVDLTVFLGDILTYGMQPLAVLDQLRIYSRDNPSVFIKGNHDQFYFDIQGGRNESSYQMPGFVEESFLWTLNTIGGEVLADLFDWRKDYLVEGIYFSHANPFEYGDWRYLEREGALVEAFDSLASKKCQIGVFGHSHRQLISVNRHGGQVLGRGVQFFTEADDLYIVNAGSVGQPRGNGFCYLMLEVESGQVSGELCPFECDIANTTGLILASDFSAETKDKLIAYLRS